RGRGLVGRRARGVRAARRARGADRGQRGGAVSRLLPVRRRGGPARPPEGEVAGEGDHRQGVDDQRRDQERVADVAQGNVDRHAPLSPACVCCAACAGGAGGAGGAAAACWWAALGPAASRAIPASNPPPASVRASPPTCTVLPLWAEGPERARTKTRRR